MGRTRKWRSSIFFRITTTFTACILAICSLQMIMYVWSSRTVREELYDSAGANAVYMKNQFENSINSIANQIQYILAAKDVREYFVYNNNYTNAERFTQAKNTLNLLDTIRNSTPIIKEIRLYYPRLNVALVSKNAPGIVQSDPVTLAERINLIRNSKTPLNELDGEYFVSAISPVSIVDSGSVPAYYIEIVLDSEEMLRNLSAFKTSKRKYSFQYNHTTGSFLFDDENAAGPEWTRILTAAIGTPPQNSEPFVVHIAEMDFTLIACHSRLLKVTYGHLLSTFDLERIPHILRGFIVIFTMASCAAIGILCLSIRRHVSQPTRLLLNAFGTTGEGHFETRVCNENYAWEYRALIDRFNEMNHELQTLVATNYEHTINLQRAQLKQLQAQINPHFLYNSFFLLRQMVRSSDRSICMDFCGCLSRYFQYITDSNADTAQLSEEYDHAKNYLYIQQMRFEDGLDIDLEPLPAHLMTMEVPRLSLQPLFENIMAHCKWEDGAIRIIRMHIMESPETVSLIVEDNGSGITDDQIRTISGHLNLDMPITETSGLDNIHRRLRLRYGEAFGLTVARSSLGGFSATITLPNGGIRNE